MAKVWAGLDFYDGWRFVVVPQEGDEWTELEVGEATLAAWSHANEAYHRTQDEIEDMVNAKRETERSI